MISTCHICLKSTQKEARYHAQCLKALFGIARLPQFDIVLGKLHTAALAMVGRTSLSGVQKKISVNLSMDRETLQVAASGGRFILKPQTEAYPSLPENEHICTRLAELVDIETALNGLVPLQDGSLAYIVRRFDRKANGAKIRQEDFCQLAELSPRDKYDASAELCIKLLRKFASEPLIEILKFYRLLLFCWWTGNGDMHLKNFSLLSTEDGQIRLTPAYDLVCTRLVIRDDPMALTVLGKKDNLNRRLWLQFASYCDLPPRTAERIIDQQMRVLPQAQALIARSFLPSEMQEEFSRLLDARTQSLQP
jgi:serine/threonine-protein kinase HipA